MRRLIFADWPPWLVDSLPAGAPSPTLQTLSYFPSTAPFVLTVRTDANAPGLKHTRALEQRFPQVALLETALFARLGQLGIDYNHQIRPLFGNPIVFGVLSARSSGSQTPFLAAWVTRSQSALTALVKKLGPALKSSGSHDGARLYATASGGTLAMMAPPCSSPARRRTSTPRLTGARAAKGSARRSTPS